MPCSPTHHRRPSLPSSKRPLREATVIMELSNQTTQRDAQSDLSRPASQPAASSAPATAPAASASCAQGQASAQTPDTPSEKIAKPSEQPQPAPAEQDQNGQPFAQIQRPSQTRQQNPAPQQRSRTMARDRYNQQSLGPFLNSSVKQVHMTTPLF